MTTLITRCPKCATTFNVTEAHLNTANGAVRCGSCLSVFNGRENLSSISKIGALLNDDDDVLISDDFIFDDDNADDLRERNASAPAKIKDLLQHTYNDDDEDDESWALKLLEDEGHDSDFLTQHNAPEPLHFARDNINKSATSNSNNAENINANNNNGLLQRTASALDTIKIESTKGPSNEVELQIPHYNENIESLAPFTQDANTTTAHRHAADTQPYQANTAILNAENIEHSNSIDLSQSTQKILATEETTKTIETETPGILEASELDPAVIEQTVEAVAIEEPAVAEENLDAAETASATDVINAQKNAKEDASQPPTAITSPSGTEQTDKGDTAIETAPIASGLLTEASDGAAEHRTPALELTPASLKAEAYANSKAQEEEAATEIDEQALAELTQVLNQEIAKKNSEHINLDTHRVPNTGANTNHRLLHSIEAETLELRYTATGNRWKIRGLWAGLALLAGSALLAQVAWMKFDRLSLQQPYRQYYGIACQYLDCILPQQRDLSKIRTTNLLVRQHPNTEGALLVDVVIQNLADFEQPFPKLVMVFSNIKDKVVASRAFEPSEYLGGDLLGATLMPQQKAIHLSLELVDPGNGAESYKIMIAP